MGEQVAVRSSSIADALQDAIAIASSRRPRVAEAKGPVARAGPGRRPGWERQWSALCCCITWPRCWPARWCPAVVPTGAGDRRRFTPYYDAMDPGLVSVYAEPPPTPVVTARLSCSARGSPRRRCACRGGTCRALGCGTGRQLALANALTPTSRRPSCGPRTRAEAGWPAAYARHLCRSRPGCRSVTLHVQQHLIPDPARSARRSRPGAAVRPLAESLFTARMDRRLPVRRLLNGPAIRMVDLWDTAGGWDAFFFSRPIRRAGFDPGGDRPPGVVEPAGLRPRPTTTWVPTAGPEPSAIRMCAIPGLVVLVPGARRGPSARLARLPGGSGLHPGSVRRVGRPCWPG
jgi:hypothetical protein